MNQRAGNGINSSRYNLAPRHDRLAGAIRSVIETLEARVMLSTVPNDPLYPQQWYLNNTGQDAANWDGNFEQVGTPGVDIDAQRAWDVTTGSHDVIVAVLDTGIDLNHPDLVPNLFTNTKEILGNGIDDDGNGLVDDVHGWDFVNNDSSPMDDVGHGTHVSGIIGAAGNNGMGVSGVNWNVQILPVKILGTNGGSWEQLAEGIRYVTQLKAEGFDIVAMNASLGGYPFPVPLDLISAMSDAARAGILFVAAAGNEAVNIDLLSEAPGKLSLSHSNVITVAATDDQDNLADFSNSGIASVSVAAPGVADFSTAPTYQSEVFTDSYNSSSFVTDYGAISGTSMAAPVVAGILALEKAANPSATMDELKAALLGGVEPIPSLAPFYALPGKVSTLGRVNAYNSVQIIRNHMIGSDSTTRGDWEGAYGSQGAYVVGDSTAFPSFADVTITGATTQVVAASTSQPRALQRPSNPADRIIGRLQTDAAGQMTIDINLTDGQSHLVSLYMDDTGGAGRRQSVDIFDPDTGRRLGGTVVRGINGGKYLTLELTGHVQLKVTRFGGPNAVVNGIFFDPAPDSATRASVAVDSTTRGQWSTHYGSQGAVIAGQVTPTPAFASVNLSGATTVVRQDRTRDQRAMELIDQTDRGVKAYQSTATTMTLDVQMTDEQSHRISLYFADYERRGRAQRIQVTDVDTGQIIDNRVITNFQNGLYVGYEISGHVQITITRMAGPDAVLSGVFFDRPYDATGDFVGIDTTTGGSWRPAYGQQGAFIYGDGTNFTNDLVYNDLTQSLIQGGTLQYISSTSSKSAALQTLGSLRNRIAAFEESPTSMTLDLNLVSPVPQRVALYVADYDHQDRIERIEVVDPDTGDVLSSQDIADFQKGKYVVFNVQDHVQFRITRLAGDSAVLSGVFIG